MRLVAAAETFCTIMSRLICGVGERLEDARGLADLVGDADDGDLGLAAVVGDAGDDGLFHGASIASGSSTTQVPSSWLNDERTWIGMS